MGVDDKLGAFSAGGTFEGFSDADFDAYAPKKWSSNAYTLARRTAKDKLLAIAEVLKAELEAPIGALELGSSDEAPTMANGRKVSAQWVYFIRPAAARKVLAPLLTTTDLSAGAGLFDIAISHQHACVALRLDHDALSIGLEIAGKARADRDNVATKLASEETKQQLLDLCAGLPGGARLGFESRETAALDLAADALAAWIDPLTAGTEPFVAQVAIPREDVIESGAALIDTVVHIAAAFFPVYDLLAWSPDNDAIALGASLSKQEKAKAKAKAAAFSPGDPVRILTGLFSGRRAYVAEVDGKGQVKVMVGPVGMNLAAKDLQAL